MLGFNHLGKLGQLGNQMFQYAALRGIANKTGTNFMIPDHQEIFDDGIGFSKQNIKDLIKPYFTTKEKGSGLGLPIVTKIVNDHNGSIKFSSHSNGAKIEIILPKTNVS